MRTSLFTFGGGATGRRGRQQRRIITGDHERRFQGRRVHVGEDALTEPGLRKRNKNRLEQARKAQERTLFPASGSFGICCEKRAGGRFSRRRCHCGLWSSSHLESEVKENRWDSPLTARSNAKNRASDCVAILMAMRVEPRRASRRPWSVAQRVATPGVAARFLCTRFCAPMS
jgi:hypothetical protein